MKLGTKVKCNGYLVKLKTKHVAMMSEKNEYLSKEELLDRFEQETLTGIITVKEYKDYLDNTEVLFVDYDEPVSQVLYMTTPKEFQGMVVSKKRIPTIRWFEIIDHECNHEIKSSILKENANYIDCYQVFFRMGGSRLVPVELCEVI